MKTDKEVVNNWIKIPQDFKYTIYTIDSEDEWLPFTFRTILNGKTVHVGEDEPKDPELTFIETNVQYEVDGWTEAKILLRKHSKIDMKNGKTMPVPTFVNSLNVDSAGNLTGMSFITAGGGNSAMNTFRFLFS